MFRALHIGLLLQMLLAGAGRGPGQYVRIERLSERVVLAYWPGIDRRCNLTAIQTAKGLVIIDTEASPRVMAPIKEKIEHTFGRSDWAYVINTHAHDNHCSGNCLFEGAIIVGHQNLPEDMQWLIRRQTEPDWKHRELERTASIHHNLRATLHQFAANPRYTRLIRSDIEFYGLFAKDLEEGYEIVKPSLMFADRHTLDMGDLTLELVFFGKGHSLSDTLVYIPQEKLLVTGAIVYQRRHLPEIGEESQLQDVHRFLAVLDEFLAEGVKIDHVVPSHSPPLAQSDLRPVRDYYQRMLKEVRAAQMQGLTVEQTTERLATWRKFPAFREPPPGNWAYGMHQRNIRNLWRILHEEGLPPKSK